MATDIIGRTTDTTDRPSIGTADIAFIIRDTTGTIGTGVKHRAAGILRRRVK
jgi:hypothetical protein